MSSALRAPLSKESFHMANDPKQVIADAKITIEERIKARKRGGDFDSRKLLALEAIADEITRLTAEVRALRLQKPDRARSPRPLIRPNVRRA
jgi:hypothetical protein